MRRVRELRILPETISRAKFPGEPEMAYFKIDSKEGETAAAVIEHVSKLAVAGYRVAAGEVAEKTGYELEEAGEKGVRNRVANGGPGSGRNPEGLPERISAEEADRQLSAGVTVEDASGRKIKFGEKLKKHLDEDVGGEQGEERKALLEWAKETVRSGKSATIRVNDEDRLHYGKVFEDRGRQRAFLTVAVAGDGEVLTITKTRVKHLQKKGLINRDGTWEERPSDAVLQLLAASGELPDGGQYSAGDGGVKGVFFGAAKNRGVAKGAASALGIDALWLEPVAEVLESLAARVTDGSVPDGELADALEEAARRLPEIFDGMTGEEFAAVLAAGMGEAATKGGGKGKDLSAD